MERFKQRKLGQWGVAYLAAAWVALQVADVLAAPLGLTETFQLRVLIGLVAGFPAVLVLAWYHGEAGRQRIRGAEVALLLAILAVGGLAVWSAGEPTDRSPPALARGELRIAVLPPVNIGPDRGDDYFAEAVAEELRERLSRVIPVKSPQSVERFRHADQDVHEIAALLGVSHLVEVRVRKDGERARVSVQLTEASSGFGAWSEVYERESDDWFELHEEMAIHFAAALGLHLTPEESDAVRTGHTDDREAYDQYWRGWRLLESFHASLDHPPEEFAEAEAHFLRALDGDPEYPLALAGLSLAYSYAYFYGVDRSEGRLERAEELARQALGLDRDLPEAHTALAQARSNRGDHGQAIQSLRDALRQDGENAVVWCLLAAVCTIPGPTEDLNEAVRAASEAIRIDPGWYYSYQVLGSALERLGRFAEAAEAYQAGTGVNEDGRANHYGLGRSLLALQRPAEALSALEAAHARGESGTLLLYIGAAHAGVGNDEAALDAVSRGLARGGGGSRFPTVEAVANSPYFAGLRGDARFQRILDRHR